MSIDDGILKFLLTYDSVSFYVGSGISQKRLQSAHKSHGVDPRDHVWAVIDSTVLGSTAGGSAENGLSITASGIYWKNMWAVRTRLTHYSWAEFVAIADRAEAKGGSVRFEPGVEFSAPAGFKSDHILNMLCAVAKLYLEQTSTCDAVPVPEESAHAAPSKQLSGPPPNPGASYPNSLGRYLAIVTCHAGLADEACVALATELLEDEEVTHPGSLSCYAETIEALEKEHQRSATFFKLKQARVISDIRQLPAEEVERIQIMCNALAEVAKGATSAHALKKIEQALQR